MGDFLGGSPPTSTTITQPPLRPPLYDWAQQAGWSYLPQLALGRLPTYPGSIDPGLSPSMQAALQFGQGRAISPAPQILGQAAASLGQFQQIPMAGQTYMTPLENPFLRQLMTTLPGLQARFQQPANNQAPSSLGPARQGGPLSLPATGGTSGPGRIPPPQTPGPPLIGPPAQPGPPLIGPPVTAQPARSPQWEAYNTAIANAIRAGVMSPEQAKTGAYSALYGGDLNRTFDLLNTAIGQGITSGKLTPEAAKTGLYADIYGAKNMPTASPAPVASPAPAPAPLGQPAAMPRQTIQMQAPASAGGAFTPTAPTRQGGPLSLSPAAQTGQAGGLPTARPPSPALQGGPATGAGPAPQAPFSGSFQPYQTPAYGETQRLMQPFSGARNPLYQQVPTQNFFGGQTSGGAPVAAGNQTGPASIWDVYQASLEPMRFGLQDTVNRAVSQAGVSGNRFSTTLPKLVAREGAAAASGLNRDFMDMLYRQGQSDLGRQFAAAQTGAGALESDIQRQFLGRSEDLNRLLQSAGMGGTLGSIADQIGRGRVQDLFGMAQYEQDRADRMSMIPYQDYLQARQGYLPDILRTLQAVGGSAGSQQSPIQMSEGGSPGALDYAIPIITSLISAGIISSRRFKASIRHFGKSVRGLRPARWIWKHTGQPGVGFIAEEVVETFPQSIFRDALGRTLGIDYARLGRELLRA